MFIFSLPKVGRAARARVAAVACAIAAFFFSTNVFSFYTTGGRIYDASGSEVVLHGLNHHGFNDPILQPQYLWTMGWKEQIAQIKSLGFTAVRLPIVPDVLYSQSTVDQLCYVEPSKNADLYGKTPLQVLDMWMAEADRQGLYVLLNMYSVSKQRQYPTWFITDSSDYYLDYKNAAYTESDWIHDLTFLASRYAGLPHFIAIDLYNEPNGNARWSYGTSVSDSAYFWKRAAEAASASILNANPNLLVFVEGIAGNWDGVEDSSIPMNWGEDLQPQAYQPLDIPADKLVLSPHTYGPDAYVKSTFYDATFPNNLAADWDTLFGKTYPGSMLVMGEWGGDHGQGPSGSWDTTWENAFVSYMENRGIKNEFWWAYTPNSAATGGILDDNLQVRTDKMTMLQALWSYGYSDPIMVASSGTTSSSTGSTSTSPTTAPTTTPTTPTTTSSGGSTKTHSQHKGALSLGGADPSLLAALVAFLGLRFLRSPHVARMQRSEREAAL